MMAPRYELADDVHVCLCDDHLFFLDLRRNKYFCLDSRNTMIATSLLSSVEENVTVNDIEIDDAEQRRIAEALLRSGLFQVSDNSKRGSDLSIPLVQQRLPAESQPHQLHFRSCAALFGASIKASWKLRHYSMIEIVRSIEKRKHMHADSSIQDHAVLFDRVTEFHLMRPFYVRKYLCLFDSLALIEFLANHNLFPDWVFGVKGRPFGAHCWVQTGDHVLNDTVEFVREFEPIMSV